MVVITLPLLLLILPVHGNSAAGHGGAEARLLSRLATCDLQNPLALAAADTAVCLATASATAGNQTVATPTPNEQRNEPPSPPLPPLASWVEGARCKVLKQGGTRFCAYTLPSFRGGEGVSVITSPDRMARIATLNVFAKDLNGTQQTAPHGQGSAAPPPPYEAVEVPGKGMGLVATRPIRAGTRLMDQSPAVMTDGRALDGLTKGEAAELLSDAIELLPAHHRDDFLQLSTHNEGSRATRRRSTRSLPRTPSGRASATTARRSTPSSPRVRTGGLLAR